MISMDLLLLLENGWRKNKKQPAELSSLVDIPSLMAAEWDRPHTSSARPSPVCVTVAFKVVRSFSRSRVSLHEKEKFLVQANTEKVRGRFLSNWENVQVC